MTKVARRPVAAILLMLGALSASWPHGTHAQPGKTQAEGHADTDQQHTDQPGASKPAHRPQPDLEGEAQTEKMQRQAKWDQAIEDSRRRKQRIQQRHAELRDWATIIVAIIGVAINAGLWTANYRQLKMNRVTADAARVSAEAAERQSRLLAAQELPVVRFEFSMPPGTTTAMSGVTYPDTRFHCRFRNYGRTPALIEYFQAKIGTGLKEVPYRTDLRYYKPRVIPASDACERFWIDFSEFSADEARAIMSHATNYWFVGDIVYADVFGGRHIVSFSWRFLPGLHDWLEDEQSGDQQPWFVHDAEPQA